jgi:DNA-binding MltR family transcriptional regulator
MVASRNRGKKKPKLRDYSHLVLTAEERNAVSAAAHSMDQHPIVTAILGYVLVEHELDVLLRKKFRKTDDATWTELQDDRGPLRSFSAKISIGYALGIYNDKIQHDLNTVRIIRNAFAHSKKLLDFNDPLVVQELLGAHRLPAKFKKHLRKDLSNQLAKASFIIICLKLESALFRIKTRAENARYRRLRRKVPISALANALLGNPYGTQPLGSPYAILHSTDLKLDPQSSPGGQSGGPSPSTPLGYAKALRPFLDDNNK